MAHDTTRNRYGYLPLAQNEIRVLCVSWKNDNMPSYGLQHASLDTSPIYSALSYTWDEQKPDQDLVCNDGSILTITRNVQTALSHLNIHSKFYTIWIDGVCINQDDTHEKEAQIPLMSRIYSMASNVIVWLGESNPRIEDALEASSALLLTLLDINGKIVPEKHTMLQYGLPELSSPIWEGLGQLFALSWWTRTWVLQEVVLATNIVVVCGTRVMEWQFLMKLAAVLVSSSLFTIIMPAHSTSLTSGNGLLTLDFVSDIRRQRAQHRNGSSWFLSLLMMAAEKQCSDPRDRLYGLIGLASTEVQQHLRITYDRTSAEVYLSYAKWAVERPGGFLVLILACSKKPMAGLPSWCPNFDAPSRTLRLGLLASTTNYHAGFEAGDQNQTCFIISSQDSKSIKTRGFLVDKILNKVQSRWKDSESSEIFQRETATQALAWEAACLKLSQKVYKQPATVPEGHWRTLIANKLINQACVTNQRREYNLLLRVLQYIYTQSQQPLHEGPRTWELLGLTISETVNVQTFGTSVSQATQGRSFISTTEGRIGLVPEEAQAGDLICVLYNVSTPLILRPRAYDKRLHELIGESYIHGLMDGEALQMYSPEQAQGFMID